MHRLNLPAAGRHASFALGWLAIAALLTVAGCDRKSSSELQPGSYRATVELPGRKLVPFGLDIAQEESGPVLYLINGAERVRLTEVTSAQGRLAARVPGYETTLKATVAGDELAGEVSLVHADGKPVRLPFAARRGETWRFYPQALPGNADFAGRWSVTFTDAGGRSSSAVALLEQEFERVAGTFQTPADDQRFLAGEAHDEELRLSRFDGGAVVLYEGRLNAQGELVGETWSDRAGPQRFVAVRNPDASIDPAALATQLRDPESGFAFSFKDVDGKTVASTDPRFAGKVLLVTLAGSWCPNSHDEATMLAQLDREYRARGLEIVSLMFEQHAGFEAAVAAVRRFRTAHGIAYPTLLAGIADKASASAALPQLDAVVAYPTAIFVDRTGRVRKIHTGFAGPATGVQHDLLVQEFELQIEALLRAGETPAADLALEPPASAATTP